MGVDKKIQISQGHDVAGYPTFSICGLSGKQKSDRDLQENYRRCLAERWNEHDTLKAELAEAKKENWYDLYTEWRTNHNTVMTAFVDREARLTEAKAENKRLREDRQKTAKRVVGLIEGLEAERDKLREVTPLIEKYISSIIKRVETVIGLELAEGQMMMVRGECKLILAALKQPKGGG